MIHQIKIEFTTNRFLDSFKNLNYAEIGLNFYLHEDIYFLVRVFFFFFLRGKLVWLELSSL